MAVILQDGRNSFKYDVNNSGEVSGRTIGGLNFGSNDALGPTITQSATNLFGILTSITTGQLTNVRFVQERRVQL